jgi:PH and SEC7 domain-containing protein
MSDSTLDDLNDDELALFGAPFAKEGNLSRKPYWDAPNKRSKEKSWKQAFVVIQKGDLHMFTFGEGSSRSTSGAAVGGGNWMVSLGAV